MGRGFESGGTHMAIDAPVNHVKELYRVMHGSMPSGSVPLCSERKPHPGGMSSWFRSSSHSATEKPKNMKSCNGAGRSEGRA